MVSSFESKCSNSQTAVRPTNSKSCILRKLTSATSFGDSPVFSSLTVSN